MSVGLPGDLSIREQTERMIRVDHAGEYGATRIYAGQLAVLGRAGNGDLFATCRRRSSITCKTFEGLIADRRVRPTALLPLWHLAGFALGAMTAAMGEKAAMACTVAVEEAIDEHYAAQLDALGAEEPVLRQTVETIPRRRVGAPRYRSGAWRGAGRRDTGCCPVSSRPDAGRRSPISERL